MYLQLFDYVNFHYRNVKAQVKPFLSPSKHSVAPAVVAEWLEQSPCNIQRQQSCSVPGLNPARDYKN